MVALRELTDSEQTTTSKRRHVRHCSLLCPAKWFLSQCVHGVRLCKPYSAGTDFRRQNLTSVQRQILKSIPALQE